MAQAYVYEDDSTGWRHIQSGDIPSGGGSPLTTKGDLYGFDTANNRIPIGSNNQVLTADSTQTLGLKWATPSGSGITDLTSTGSTITVTTPTGPTTNVDLPTSGVTAATYGNSSNVGQFTVNAEGIITAAANVSIGASVVTGADGWIDDTAETWTFATANTFTVATDLRSKYTVGSRIKLTQTTVKYFVVSANPTFAGGNTTVTITGGSDYTFVNAAVSANFHSYVVNPQGWPTWFNWTPSPTGYSGSPTVIARFAPWGRQCTTYIDVSGTSNTNASAFTLPIPVGPGMTDGPVFLIMFGFDNSVRLNAPGNMSFPASGSTVTTGKAMNTGGGWTNSGTKQYLCTFTYEI